MNLYIVGSLREKSFNKKLAERLKELAGGEIALINDIPMFNQDLEKNPPEAVTELRKKVLAADNIIFVSPEYNYTIPGTTKNVVDWLSRPYSGNPHVLLKKKAYIAGASLGFAGTARMQKDLLTLLKMIGTDVKTQALYVVINNQTGKWSDDTEKLIGEFADKLK